MYKLIAMRLLGLLLWEVLNDSECGLLSLVLDFDSARLALNHLDIILDRFSLFLWEILNDSQSSLLIVFVEFEVVSLPLDHLYIIVRLLLIDLLFGEVLNNGQGCPLLIVVDNLNII